MNERNSVKLVGVGNFLIAFSLSGSASIPSLLNTNPTYFTLFLANSNFFLLIEIPCVRQRCSSSLILSTCVENFSSYCRISSTIFFTLWSPSNAASINRLYLSPVDDNPIGARKNLYLPQGVMNVVSG